MQKHILEPQAFKLQKTGMKAPDVRAAMLLEGVAPRLHVMSSWEISLKFETQPAPLLPNSSSFN